MTDTVKERPIPFSGPMVQAIIEGRKTQTRRVVKTRGADRVLYVDGAVQVPQRAGDKPFSGWVGEVDKLGGATGLHLPLTCPYGIVGDRLWVREALRPGVAKKMGNGEEGRTVQYAVDTTPVPYSEVSKLGWCGHAMWTWKVKVLTARYMPRWASRTMLQVVEVRVQRLQDISYGDCMAEGVDMGKVKYKPNWDASPFSTLWDSINGKRASWQSNPWVWVIEFKRIGANNG